MARATVVRDLGEISYAHALLNYDGKCASLHGHNAKVVVTINGPVCDDGMVIDFTVLADFEEKLQMLYDHRTFLHEDTAKHGGCTSIDPRVHYMRENPTAEVLARSMLDRLMEWLRRRCSAGATENLYVTLEFSETAKCSVIVDDIVTWGGADVECSEAKQRDTG